jgi:hypothetical protein
MLDDSLRRISRDFTKVDVKATQALAECAD